MDLTQIAVFSAGGLCYALVIPIRWRGWVLFIASILAIYWLQPTLTIRWLDYALPTATLVITVIGWWVTSAQNRLTRDDQISLVVIIALILLLTLPRYLNLPFEITSRPPEISSVVIALIISGGLAAVLGRTLPRNIWLLLLIVIFIVVKSAPLSTQLSAFLRAQSGQDAALANPIDIGWLGFSYVAFRLIHTLRDRQSGILPELLLRTYVTYVIFFPAYTAGPIDRAERFAEDYLPTPQGGQNVGTRPASSVSRTTQALSLHGTGFRDGDNDPIFPGLTRIFCGLFKKFVIADSLALFSLSATMADQATSTGGVWVMLYAYAFRLLFDFSGYTDIAIGIGMLFGIQLPENFNRPYFKQHIAAFWQSWHITLSSWARFYIYSPLSRSLLRRELPNTTIILICNLTTMSVIGLWHGITAPFLVWGVWHGVGLTVHKLWSDRTRSWYRGLEGRRKQVWHIAGILLTFHFVLLGWVWFALPDLDSAVRVWLRLFGL